MNHSTRAGAGLVAGILALGAGPTTAMAAPVSDSQAVHHEIQRLLVRWEGTRIDQITQSHYRCFRYFGVSALGETPTEDNHVSARGIRPIRVGDPFIWTLAQLGVIPVKRG